MFTASVNHGRWFDLVRVCLSFFVKSLSLCGCVCVQQFNRGLCSLLLPILVGGLIYFVFVFVFGVIGTTLGAKKNNADSRIDPEALELQQRTLMFDKKKTPEQLHAAAEELRLQ